MKKKLFFICKLLLVFFILLVINFAFCDDIHSYTRAMLDEMYSEQENIDVVFIGASLVTKGINPTISDEKLKCNTFNASSSLQNLQGAYYLLNEILKTNHPKTVVLEMVFRMNGNYYTPDTLEMYLLTDYMKGKDKYHYLWEQSKFEGILNNAFPVLHNFGSPSFLLKAKLSDGYVMGNYKYISYPNAEYRGRGYVCSFEHLDESDDLNLWGCNVDANKPMSDFAEKWLNRIITRCRDEGIELLLYASPLVKQAVDKVENYDLYAKKVTEICELNGLKYYDFNLMENAGLDLDFDDYQDDHHLNGQGADKFTSFFCDILINTGKQNF